MKHFVLCAIILFVFESVQAQWVQTSLDSVTVMAFTKSGMNLFAGTGGISDDGIFLSTNNGTSWSAVNNGLPAYSFICAFAVSGTNLFVGTGGNGVFLSTNNGANWTAVNNGLPKDVNGSYRAIFALAFSYTNLFAGTDGGGIFLSSNHGENWTAVNNGLTDTCIYTFAVSPNGAGRGLPKGSSIDSSSSTNLFAGANNGVFLSSDNGANWNLVNRYLASSSILSLAISDTNLFAGTISHGVYRSTDNGTTWTVTNDGLTNHYIEAFAISRVNIFTGTSSGVFLSTNYGSNWIDVNSGLTKTDIQSLIVLGTNLFAGTYGNGVWRRPISEMIPTSVEHSSSQLPETYSLSQNYPNPFNPTTVIRYQLPVNSNVSLIIYDLLGREIATLVNERQSAGWKEVEWNATNFASGMYLVRMQTGSFVETKKILLMK